MTEDSKKQKNISVKVYLFILAVSAAVTFTARLVASGYSLSSFGEGDLVRGILSAVFFFIILSSMYLAFYIYMKRYLHLTDKSDRSFYVVVLSSMITILASMFFYQVVPYIMPLALVMLLTSVLFNERAGIFLLLLTSFIYILIITLFMTSDIEVIKSMMLTAVINSVGALFMVLWLNRNYTRVRVIGVALAVSIVMILLGQSIYFFRSETNGFMLWENLSFIISRAIISPPFYSTCLLLRLTSSF